MSRLCILFLLVLAPSVLGSWLEFRGPGGTGITPGTNLPVHWGEGRNVKWKTPIPGRAWSSPVGMQGKIWLTTATTNGQELSVLRVDAASGRMDLNRKLFQVENPQYCHPFNTYASPTPVLEPGRVYVTFGAAGTACLDAGDARVLWEVRNLECNHFRGPGSSPILYRDLLILNFDGSDKQYVAAFEKQTGKIAWKTERSIDFRDLDGAGNPQMEGDYRKAYGTCLGIEVDGAPVLLSQGSKALYGYEPVSGRELWRLEERSSYSGSTRPVFGHGLIYLPSGFSSGEILAIRPGKNGEVLDARGANSAPGVQLRVEWRTRKNAPKKPSLLLIGRLLFGVDDNGTATCWNALTGEVFWSERLGGHFSASPIGNAQHVYFFSEEGKTTVVLAAPEFRKIAENDLGDGFMATPAPWEGGLILRSRSHLYLITETR